MVTECNLIDFKIVLFLFAGSFNQEKTIKKIVNDAHFNAEK